MGRPAAVGEDTALRALRDWLRRVRSRVSDEGRQYGNQRNIVAATVKRRAASVPVGRRHAGAGGRQARSALIAEVRWSSRRSLFDRSECQAGHRGARKPTPKGDRGKQFVQCAAKKGAMPPAGYKSPRSEKERMSRPATIR